MSNTPPLFGSAVYGVALFTSASSITGARKRMARIALNIRGLSVNDKLGKGHTALTAAGTAEGILVLGTPAPAEVAGLQTATDTLETKRDAKLAADNAAKTSTQAQQDAEDLFDEAFAAYGRIAQTKSGGEPVKIGQVGLTIIGPSSPIGEMTQVLNLVATMGDLVGEVDLMFDPVHGAKSYIVQYCADPMTGNWQQFDIVTKSKCTVTGLTSGTKYWFRVSAKGSAPGQGPWSDPAQKMAT